MALFQRTKLMPSRSSALRPARQLTRAVAQHVGDPRQRCAHGHARQYQLDHDVLLSRFASLRHAHYSALRKAHATEGEPQ